MGKYHLGCWNSIPNTDFYLFQVQFSVVDPCHHRHYPYNVESVGLSPVQVRQRQLSDQPCQQLHETANVQQHVQNVHGKSEP